MPLSERDRAELQSVVGSGSYDGSVSARAQIVLWHDEGYPKVKITEMSGASRPTVNKWLKRYEKGGLGALVNLTSPGGPRQIPDRIRGRVLALTRTTPPSALGISHWSSAEMARYIKKTEGVYGSQTWISRLWRENGVQPWRQGTFKISRDPHFEDKVRDIVGLYLDPPEGEVVVSVDAKSGIQVLDRTQPLLLIDFGKTQKWTFEYKRMGTTDLYAALDIRTGTVITSLSQTHATPDFLRLMKKVVAEYPGQKIHVVLDNASVPLSADTEEWLAKRKGQVIFHFTPTGASWLNQIEIWNGILTRKVIRCGTFSSVKILNREIESFVAHWNSDCGPINWTVSAEEILDKVRAITSRMESLLRATEIDDVARRAA
jgi:transposase